MRSQKQTNKAPRPHKSQSAARGFSGGHGGLIPAPSFALRAKKSVTPPETPSVAPSPASAGKTPPPAGAS
ncbi:MAG: hypothetical protein V4726_07490 [Verrucomicrobiota bacterium]